MKLSLLAILVLSVLPTGSASPGRTLVVCAPGYPGNTEQAQPTMDAFAAGVSRAAELPAGALSAAYYETAEAGIRRLEEADAALALVPLAFFLEHGESLGLRPVLQAVHRDGPREVWSLVAGKGRLARGASLDGWEVSSRAGYSERFVRHVLLRPRLAGEERVKVTFTPRVLAALRRAASDERVAVLLDGDQAGALGALPFAKDLEVAYRSDPVPRHLLCVVRDRVGEAESGALIRGFLDLHRSGGDVLETLGLRRFNRVDEALLAGVVEAWRADG